MCGTRVSTVEIASTPHLTHGGFESDVRFEGGYLACWLPCWTKVVGFQETSFAAVSPYQFGDDHILHLQTRKWGRRMLKRSGSASTQRLDTRYGGRERYSQKKRETFIELYKPFLRESITVLDVGSGRAPAIPVGQRPENCRYLGLDISESELALAPEGSYDERFVQDLRDHDPRLDDQVDLALSWQVLEHIDPLAAAIENVRAYLKPGGHFVALLSGRNAYFAVINRFIPESVGVLAMKHLLGRPPDTVFRAHYDSCTHTELSTLLQAWSHVEIVPQYRGAVYLNFSRSLSKFYFLYEDWAAQSHKKDLATHYIVVATK